MGTTASHALPYPGDGDLVTQGAQAMQALAEAVDALLPVHRTITFTTDASGFYTYTHGLGYAPSQILSVLDRATGALYSHILFDTITTTTVRLRVLDSAGTAANAATVPVRISFWK